MQIKSKIVFAVMLSVVLMTSMTRGEESDRKNTMRQIMIGAQSSGMEQLAAKELQRYLWQVSGSFLEITTGGSPTPDSILLGQRQTNLLIEQLASEGRISVSGSEPGPQGYILKSTSLDNKPILVIAGSDDVGCLYGVYGLLEKHFGLSFGMAGDVLPDDKKSLDLPAIDERHMPSVLIRGFIPWSNFPQSTTVYSWEDWKSVIDQMGKMRLNLLMIHNYNGDSSGVNEMYHNFPIDGKLPRVSLGHTKAGYMIGGPAWQPWEFRFRGRDLFDDCDFGSETMLHGDSLSNEELFARGVTMFQRVIAYAHTRGVKMALGTDVNLTLRGYEPRVDSLTRGRMAAEPEVVKTRIGQVIRDYPDLDYFVAFSWEGMPKNAETLPVWEGIVRLIHSELKEKAPGIGLAVASWGIPPEWVVNLPEDVICAPISGYSARPQDGNIFGKRDFWACPWLEKDNDDSMFYFPFRTLLSDTVDAWQKRSSNTKGLYALTWRNTDAIDAKLWYIAHAPWDKENRLKTSRDAYYAYAVANYGREGADAVIDIINEKEAFASNMCEMGGPRPFREFASIMWSWPVVTFKGFGVPAKDGKLQRIPAVSYSWNNGGKKQKVDTPDSYVNEIASGIWLEYKNVDFGEGTDQVEIQAATDRGARVEIRLQNADGPLLGQCVVPVGKGWEDFQTVALPIKRTSGMQTIVVAFSNEIYPRRELVKAEEQIAIVDRTMVKASPTQRQRLDLLRTRLAAVRDHIRLNLEFPEYRLEDLPGAMESWVMNFIRRVDDISSLGTLSSIQGRYVQHTYLRNKVEPFYAGQAIRPPLDVEARGTGEGAEIRWRDMRIMDDVRGFRVYRNGLLLTKEDLPANENLFRDKADGEYNYTVTAVGPDNKESLHSVKSRCLAGKADRDAPFIVMVSPPLSGFEGQTVWVKARVVDGRAYDCISAKLYYRPLGGQEWTALSMTRRVRAVFTAELTPNVLGSSGVEYYIEATDGGNTGRYPLAAPARNLSLMLCAASKAPRPTSPEIAADKGVLSWIETPNAYWYRIYRGRTPDFAAGPESYLTYVAQGTTAFKDTEEDFDGTPREGIYYYRVTAMNRDGYESAASVPVPIMSIMYLNAGVAELTGGVKLASASAASSGRVAGWFSNPGDQIIFRNVPACTGFRIRFSNGNTAPKQCGLYVNGKRVETLAFPVTTTDTAGSYVNGVRVADVAGAAVNGDWNIFSVLAVNVPVEGEISFRIDKEDAEANRSACCNIDRLELDPKLGGAGD